MDYNFKNIKSNEILLYLRKSRKDYEFINEDIEKTLERHEKILQDFALKTFNQIIPPENIYREVVSGDTIIDRPEMQKVLSLIENNKYKGVLVLEIERLARGNTIDQGVIAQTFQFTKTLIITPQKIYNLDDELDRSFFEDGLFQSRKYLLYTKKILSRGRVQSVSEGKFVGSTTPFGYNKEKLKNEKGYKLVINEIEAEIIKLIFDKFLNEDLGTSKIAYYLNSISAKPRKNSKWTPAMVRNIIMNISITGRLTWNKRKSVSSIDNGELIKSRPNNNDCMIIKGLHEPIIDIDTWDKAQNKLKRLHIVKKTTTIQNPLSGLVYCKICGHSMIRRPYPNHDNDTLMCSIAHCQNVSSYLKLVEEKVLDNLKEHIKKFTIATNDIELQKQSKNYDTLIKNIDNEIETLKKQYQKACELLELGVYNINEFMERKETLNNELKAKTSAKNLILEEQKNTLTHKYDILIPKLETAIKIYNKLTTQEKNDLLKSLIKRIDYLKTHNCRWNKGKINDFAIEIQLKI